MIVDMEVPTFDGVPFLGAGGPGASVPSGVGAPIGGAGGSSGGTSLDSIVGDIKMAARTDDHNESAAEWLLCDGRAVSRLTYTTLFGVIGIVYGPGDGLNTFNLPLMTASAVPGSPAGRSPLGAVVGPYPLGSAAGLEKHKHSWAGGLAPLVHAWNPLPQTANDAPFLTDPGGGNAASSAPHAHTLPVVQHVAPPWPDSDQTTVQSPYLSVGHFIRTL